MPMKTLFLGLLALALGGCFQRQEEVIATCRLDAVKFLGHLRRPHPVSGLPWPSQQEVDYVGDCMRSKGYKLKDSCVDAPIFPEITSTLSTGGLCWENRYEWLVPRILRKD